MTRDSRLKAVPEAEGDDRVILKEFDVITDLLLLGLDVALDRRIGSNVSAVQSAGIAGAAGESERRLRAALEDSSELDRRAEVLAARNQIAESDQDHWRGFVQAQFAGANKRIDGAAAIVNVIQREGLASRYRRIRCHLIPVVEQHAGTQVKSAAEGKEVEQSVHRAEAESAFVRNSVVKKVAAVIQRVEAAPYVGATRNRYRNIKTCAEGRKLAANPDAESQIAVSFIAWRCKRASRNKNAQEEPHHEHGRFSHCNYLTCM